MQFSIEPLSDKSFAIETLKSNTAGKAGGLICWSLKGAFKTVSRYAADRPSYVQTSLLLHRLFGSC